MLRTYVLLLLLVVSPTQTIGWESFAAYKSLWNRVTSTITTHITHYISSITPEKIISCTGAAFVAYYLYNKVVVPYKEKKKRTNHIVGTIPQSLQYSPLLASYQAQHLSPLTDSVSVSQISVADQFALGGFSNASCGYHALKNGLCLAQWSKHGESQQEFMNGPVDALFGAENSPWRQLVIDARKTNAFKQYIGTLISLKPESEIEERFGIQVDELKSNFKKEKIRSVYQSLLSDIVSEIAPQAIRNSYTLSKESFKALLREKIRRKNIELADEYLTDATEQTQTTLCDSITSVEAIKIYLLRDETIDRYFNVTNLDDQKNIEPSDISTAVAVYNQRASKSLNLNGEWLNEAEVALLITGNELCPEITKDNVTVFDSRQALTDYSFSSDNDDDLSLVKNKIQQKHDYEHIFVCGTMDQDSGSDGHWFVVVLIKRGNKREYIAADSMGTDRIRDESVRRLIQLLESNDAIYPSSVCSLV